MQDVSLDDIQYFLSDNDEFLILCHQSPDCDTLGSAFALYHFLSANGKKAAVACSDPFPKSYYFLYGSAVNAQSEPLSKEQLSEMGVDINTFFTNDQTFVPNVYVAGMTKTVFVPQTVIACDVADPELLGSGLEPWKNSVDLVIDHHISHRDFATQGYVDHTAAATCEIVSKLFREYYSGNEYFTPIVAACLFTGISTDTGCFRYPSTTSGTHDMIAWLMKFDFPYNDIIRTVFLTKSRARFELEQFALSKMSFHFNNKLAIIAIDKASIYANNMQNMDFNNLANFPSQLEGVEIGVSIKEKLDKNGVFKVSMRTTGNLDVSALCEQFGGGGHKKAAGCVMEGTINEVISNLKNAAKRAIDELPELKNVRIVIG